LLLDNYDSFTYNLAQYLGEFGCNVEVHRNDKISVEHIAQRKPEAIIISPGPCTPQEAGISVELVQKLAGKISNLGVCLGHQAIGAAFGGKIIRAPNSFTARPAKFSRWQRRLSQTAEAFRCHALSFAHRRTQIPSARARGDRTNRRRHHHGLPPPPLQTRRVQFHPSPVLTTSGKQLLKNFLSL